MVTEKSGYLFPSWVWRAWYRIGGKLRLYHLVNTSLGDTSSISVHGFISLDDFFPAYYNEIADVPIL